MTGFYLDHDVPTDLAVFLTGAGYPSVTVRQLGTRTSPDSFHLLEAARSGRVLVSHNKRDYILLNDAWLRWSREWSIRPIHSGILLVPQISTTRLFAAIIELLDSGPDLTNRIYRWTSAGRWEAVA